MRQDLAEKEYFSNPERVADLLNAVYFHGEMRIQAEDVKERDSQLIYVPQVGKTEVSYHDLVYRVIYGDSFFIFGIQNQTAVDPLMSFRTAEYTVREYSRQIKSIKAGHRLVKDLKREEYITGYSREDKINPVIILTIYYGIEEWKGARQLSELLDPNGIPEEFQYLLLDAEINLLEVRTFENIGHFRTDLKLVFGFLQRQRNKMDLKKFMDENRKKFSELNMEAYQVIREVSGLKQIALAEQKKGGNINMCKAIEEMILDGKAEGKAEIVTIVRKKKEKGYGEKRIADMLEISENYAEELIRLIKENPQATDFQIAERYLEQKTHDFGIF